MEGTASPCTLGLCVTDGPPAYSAPQITLTLTMPVDLQVISWWGPSWREGTHDTQGVNTDAVLGLVIRELEQQQGSSAVKLAFHLEPYEGVKGPAGGHSS